MSESKPHLDRMDYYSTVEAFTDALRCQEQLLEVLEAQLVVPAAEIEFLARRCRSLIRAALRHAERFEAGKPVEGQPQ